MSNLLFEELSCEGSYREMGAIQGEWLKPRFQHILSSLVDNPLTPKWIRWLGPNVLKTLLVVKGASVNEHHRPNMEESTPSQIQRIQGIAEGAGLSLPLLMGLGSIETQAAHFQFILGCSSLAIGKTRSVDSTPLLAYNHDFPAFMRDHLFARRSYPKKGFKSVQLTYATLPGAIAGVNEAGLAITLNHAFTTEEFNRGVPPTYVVQEALDHCKTAEQAFELFARTTFSCGSMVTVLDEQGAMYALELSRERFGYRVPQNDTSLTLNFYGVDHMQEIEVPQTSKFHPKKFPEFFHDIFIHQSNWDRRDRFEELLAAHERMSVEDLKSFFADHGESEGGDIGSICRHHETSDTVAHAILHPEKRMLEASRGYACQAEYQQFQL